MAQAEPSGLVAADPAPGNAGPVTLSTSSTLPSGTYLEHLRRDGSALADAAARDIGADVPGCPEWDVAALVGHTSLIHRWVTRILETRAQERAGRRDIGPAPEGPAVEAWYREGLAGLIGAFEGIGPDDQVWNWVTGVSPPAFWFRRMAQETAVHRWDAQSATGSVDPIDAQLAVDGIAEMLGCFLPLLGSSESGGLGGSIHVHATDSDGEWTVRDADGGGFVVEDGHAKGDAAVRGPASDLLLALWGRPTIDALEVFGDDGLVRRWRELVRF